MNINPNEFQMQYLALLGFVSVLLLLAKEFTAFFLVIVGFAAGAVVFHRTTFHGIPFLNFKVHSKGIQMVHYNSIKSVKGFSAGINSQKPSNHTGGPTLSIGKKACGGDSGQGNTDKTSDGSWFSKRDSNGSENLSDSSDDSDDSKRN